MNLSIIMRLFLRTLTLLIFVAVLSCDVVYDKQSQFCDLRTDRSYDEISDKMILWSEIFNVISSDYLVYVYSAYCGHCLSIKNLVIGTALCEIEEIYFVTYSSEVVIAQDVENTIGVASVDAIWIRGYPTLLRIYDGILIMNIAGASAISDYLTDLISDKY